MKFISTLMVLFLLLMIPVQAQITRYYDVGDIFEGTYWDDYITETRSRDANNDDYYYRYLTSTDSSADTITSAVIENRAFGDHHLSVTSVTDSAGAVNPDTIISVLEMGVFRGRGTVSGTAGGTVDTEGYLWKHIVTITQDTSFEVSLKDSTWWTDFPAPSYMYRWRETIEQSNKYYLSDFAFKED